MSKVSINESTLTAIGAAIREKTGKTELIAPGNMPAEIRGIVSGGGSDDCNGLHIPEEALNITGNCMYKFAGNGMNWFIERVGDKITTSNINNATSMFQDSDQLKAIPFKINVISNANITYMFRNCKELETIAHDIDCNHTNYTDMNQIFMSCNKLKTVPYFYYAYPSSISNLFANCCSLREIPEDYCDTWNFDRMLTYTYASANSLFTGCDSLRKFPNAIIDKFENMIASSTSSVPYYYMVNNCYALDEIIDLCALTKQLTSNVFSNAFNSTFRLKNMTFKMNEDGTPLVREWKGQTIDLSYYAGFILSASYIEKLFNYNSGITADKEVKDDATYQALKNDPDWFSAKVEYSRYNHDSAVATINSLPDTSAYGTNIIKFKGAAGSATDGGAINTLTEAEIAVAAAKGWTVSLVS